jgi:hypothetical protein
VQSTAISISSQDYHPQQYVDCRQIYLPSKQETLRLFQVYFEYVGWYQNIIHEPHARDMIEDVYHQVVHVSTTTAPRGLALILSVIALSVVFEPLDEDLVACLPNLKERLKKSALYLRMATDCMEMHDRRMNHSLESVQAMIVLQFLVNHIEAFSSRCRALLTDAIRVAYSLGLHLIDSTATQRNPSRNERDPTQHEIKRRVWWYLTATDWLVSLAEGRVFPCYRFDWAADSTKSPSMPSTSFSLNTLHAKSLGILMTTTSVTLKSMIARYRNQL